MTAIEQKALALVNEVAKKFDVTPWESIDRRSFLEEVLCLSIEQHEQFKREVSDAIEYFMDGPVGLGTARERLGRFILPKPDKQLRSIAADRLVYAASEHFCNRKNNLELIDAIVELAARAALAKRGLEVREIEG